MSQDEIGGQFYVSGKVTGKLVKSERPISFWGGLDPKEGKIIDRRSDICGREVADRILAFPEGIGSSTTSAVLLEAVRNSRAPLGIVNITTEPILLTGALVAKEFYGEVIPIVSVSREEFEKLKDGQKLTLDGNRSKLLVG